MEIAAKVKIINKSNNPLPEYQTTGSAGMDLRAYLNETVSIRPLERKLIKTGLYIELPDGYEAQVRPRSGLALKQGVTVLNTPGTIDTDYRGEIGVILVNISEEEVKVNNGDRIAQLVITQFSKIEWIQEQQLSESSRGVGGYGSTGKT